jgi:polyisoprenyl-teichoic acid--peptidoglycan teichoic acid transferase
MGGNGMKPGFFTKKRIVAGVIVIVVVLLAAGGVYAIQMLDKITNNPTDLFNQTSAPTDTPEETPTPGPATTAPQQTESAPGQTSDTPATSAAPTATVDPAQYIDSQADKSIMKDTLNILLVGVDQAPERINNPKQYVDKNFNSDVMLLLTLNFKTNKVDMISFPRDSYAPIANMDGIYKLNFALTAGGGINDRGFMNVCKSVQGLLGGKIPVNYYIAVTMPAVKQLTDSIGGVDYDMDVNFTIDGRSYKKGMQHMTGQGVLDYCRVRKGTLSAQPGDLNRVNRQKKMLVAVFKKLQSTASIFNVPQILTSMKDNVYTNMNFPQLAALAVFGSKLPEKNITMRTLPGTYEYGIFRRNFVLLDQDKRVQMIKDVFGVSVAPMYDYAANYARLLWAYMQGTTWLDDINKLLVKDAKLGDAKKLIDPVKVAELTSAISNTRDMLDKYHSRLYNDKKPVVAKGEYVELQKQIAALKTVAQSTFSAAGYKIVWSQVYVPMTLRMKE